MLIINPQWVTEGNVVSDLGFLPWNKKANEELIASFQEVGGLWGKKQVVGVGRLASPGG